MGLYWATCVYHGRLLRKSTYDAYCALDDDMRHGCEVIPVAQDTYVLHVPGRGFWAGNIDPMLEAHEVNRGWVDGEEVDRVIDSRPGKREAWDAATPEQVAHVDDVVRALGGHIPCTAAAIAVYLCEVQWDSYGSSSMARLCKNIIVRTN